MLARYLLKVDRLADAIEVEVDSGQRPSRDGWRCACGKFGRDDARFCAYCGRGRDGNGAA